MASTTWLISGNVCSTANATFLSSSLITFNISIVDKVSMCWLAVLRLSVISLVKSILMALAQYRYVALDNREFYIYQQHAYPISIPTHGCFTG